ncbi:MAG: GH3 auxin-responsive promoter family protein [Planctomycetota bacterium]
MAWTGLIGWGLGVKMSARARKLANENFWQCETGRIQRDTLSQLVRTGANTEFGRAHGFAKLATLNGDDLVRAYRSAVPLTDWYGIADSVKRMREGAEPGVLWPGLVKHFAQTSGTTAGDKFIPVSREMFRSNYESSLDIFAYLMRRGVHARDIMSGRCLFLGGSSDLHEDANGIITGDLSGLVTPLIKWPLSQIYSPGPKIALMSDWPAKIEAMAELAIDQDIRFISGMPSWALVLMKRIRELDAERNGGPVETHGRTFDAIWPNLRVFVHGGVRFAPFTSRVAELWDGDPSSDLPNRHELYPASEGFIAQQDRAGEPGMRLMSDVGNVVEFVPTECVNDDGSLAQDAPAYLADEVEKGVRYCVVITSCAGLWRYNIGDVVEFDDVPDSFDGVRTGTGPSRLRIVGRHRHFINAFGENIIVEHIEESVAEAARSAGLTVGEFSAAPVYPGEEQKAGLELVVEVPQGAHGDADLLSRFGAAFDAGVKRRNVDYTTKRGEDAGMGPPTVTPVPIGTFHRWMDSEGKLGGQHKCPRCANHRDIVGGVLGISRETSGSSAAT